MSDSAPITDALLVNLGTPEAPEPAAVRAFLDEFLSDPNVVDLPRWLWLPVLRGIILRRRPQRVARAYGEIWREEGSPLVLGTVALTHAVAEHTGGRVRVDWCLRYGKRSLAACLPEILRRAEGRVAVVPLFPHRTPPTTGTIFEEARRFAREAGAADRLAEVLIAPDDPGFVAAQADLFRRAISEAEREPEHLLLSYHSIPQRFSDRDNGQYVADCHRTTQALLLELGWPPERATTCFQSRFGPMKWVGPFVDELLEQMATGGCRTVALASPGFLTEGLETLEELGIRGRETFLSAGGASFISIPCVDGHPLLAASIARTLEQAPP